MSVHIKFTCEGLSALQKEKSVKMQGFDSIAYQCTPFVQHFTRCLLMYVLHTLDLLLMTHSNYLNVLNYIKEITPIKIFFFHRCITVDD